MKKYVYTLALTGIVMVNGTYTYYVYERNKKTKQYDPLTTVLDVDLKKFSGNWYEISKLSPRYEDKACNSQVHYTLQPNGMIEVKNTVNLGSVDGPQKTITGFAKPTDSTNAKWNLTYYWPFSTQYWITDLDENYEWAVVGEPTRENLWILSRKPKMDRNIYTGLVEKARAKQFAVEKLHETPQKDA